MKQPTASVIDTWRSLSRREKIDYLSGVLRQYPPSHPEVQYIRAMVERIEKNV